VGGIPCQQHVANGSGRIDAVGVKTQPNSAFGVVGQVLGVVQPPRAVVVPEVMVQVVADADGDLRCIHGVCVVWHTRNPGNKKPPIPIRKRR